MKKTNFEGIFNIKLWTSTTYITETSLHKHQLITPHADKTRTPKTTTIAKQSSVTAKPTKCANIYEYPINAQLNELDYIISNIIHV